jgi:hypothetical protein
MDVWHSAASIAIISSLRASRHSSTMVVDLLLVAAARSQRRPSSWADLPPLNQVALGVTFLADAAVAEGRAATAMLLTTGVPELLIQVQAKLPPSRVCLTPHLHDAGLGAGTIVSWVEWPHVFCQHQNLLAPAAYHGARADVQLQTPWLANVGSAWRGQGRAALRAMAQQHPAALQRAVDAVDVPFPPDTSPVAWQAWWADLRAELQASKSE